MTKVSMKDYAPNDFHGYFAGALFSHPKEGRPCFIRDVMAEGTCSVSDFSGQNLGSINYKDLPFDAFSNYPSLGYRHIEDGKFLYFLSRIAQRQRGKGLRSNTLQIARVPEVVNLCRVAGLANEFQSKAILNMPMAEAILTPNYVAVADAVRTMKENPSSLGMAITNSVAVVLSTSDRYSFLMLFKGVRVATSVDGSVWVATHEEYASLLKRTLPSLKLEIKV